MTTYPYAVTIHHNGKSTIERVIAFGPFDAYQQAIIGYVGAKNVAGESCNGVTVVRVEPDFTMVSRPESNLTPDALGNAVTTALLDGLAKRMARPVGPERDSTQPSDEEGKNTP